MRAFTDVDRAAMADPTFAERYRRTAAHDGRCDGSFVVGWPMSETFCRPGCSSRTPRPSRVTFFRTAAAAHAAGLVPCPRCRPDMTPPAPELTRGDSLAARALRLIEDGEIDRHGVGGVARRLGVTSRHVLRAVTDAADCGPLDLARAQRVHLARSLLTATAIPMRDVAVAAGFPSVRQYNSTMLDLYRSTPGAIRFGPRSATPGYREPGPLVMRCVLPTPAPVSTRVLGVWSSRAIPEVEEGTDRWFARSLRLPQGVGHVRIDVDAVGQVLAKFTVTDLRDLTPLVNRTRRLMARAVDSALLSGPTSFGKSAIAAETGAMDATEALLRVVIGAETSVNQSRTILGGLAAALGDVTPWGRVFPDAESIARAGREVLRGPTERVDNVIRVARAVASGEIDVSAGWSWDHLAAHHAAILRL